MLENNILHENMEPEYLLYLNNLRLFPALTKLINVRFHTSSPMSGWLGLYTLTCIDQKGSIIDIDIRLAYGSEIFKQFLVDHGWNKEILLYKKRRIKNCHHKVIIYFCEPSLNLNQQLLKSQVPQDFILGSYWQSIKHFYLPLPSNHPFIFPKTLSNDTRSGYATTRQVIQQGIKQSDTLPETELSCSFLPYEPKQNLEGGLRTRNLFKCKFEDQPFISVITVVFNGERYIEQTIQSVINQSIDHLEYIIIDGGSTDGTLNIIRKYENEINYWISEPDKGIFDAMNKGNSLALGSHTIYTNADDLLFNSDCLNFKLQYKNHLRGVFIYHLQDQLLIDVPPKFIDKNKYKNMINPPVHHPGFIGLKTAHSVFDSNYKLMADSIVIANKIEMEMIETSSQNIAIYRSGGASSENNFELLEELRCAISESQNIEAYFALALHDIYCRLREIAKIIGLVKLKRKLFSNS
jgi:hypothetical protein